MICNVDWVEDRDSFIQLIEETELRNSHEMVKEIDDDLLSGMALAFKGDGGFFVLKPYTNDGIPHVTILFAYCTKNNAIRKYQSSIESMSRDIGARSVRLYTTVEKLSPLLENEGYAIVENDNGVYCWKKEL